MNDFIFLFFALISSLCIGYGYVGIVLTEDGFVRKNKIVEVTVTSIYFIVMGVIILIFILT